MGVLEMPAEMPDVDVYGIPEYRCSEMRMEVAGGDVRMVFGEKRFSQMQWLYTAVVEPEKLVMFCRAAERFALEILNNKSMTDNRRVAGRGH